MNVIYNKFYRQHQVWRSTYHNHVCPDDDHRKRHNHHTAHAKIHEVTVWTE